MYLRRVGGLVSNLVVGLATGSSKGLLFVGFYPQLAASPLSEQRDYVDSACGMITPAGQTPGSRLRCG